MESANISIVTNFHLCVDVSACYVTFAPPTPRPMLSDQQFERLIGSEGQAIIAGKLRFW
jgi:hypothetical protein